MRLFDETYLEQRIKQRQRMRWLAEFVVAGLCVFMLVWLFTKL